MSNCPDSGAGDDRERNVHVSDDVDFVRVLNVVDDEFARIEPGLAVVCAEAKPFRLPRKPGRGSGLWTCTA